MSLKSTGRPPGGQDFSGATFNTGRDVIMGDQINHMSNADNEALERSVRLVREAVLTAPPGIQAEAEPHVERLQAEGAKGETADDGALAHAIDSIVALVPAAGSAIANAFGSQLLRSAVGVLTSAALQRLGVG